MRIAMVDPSLFTLPYDVALIKGFSDIGQDARLLGRALRQGEQAGGVSIDPGFYPVAERATVARFPKSVRLGVKGLDHAASLARLWRKLRGWAPEVIHFQWLALPAIDRMFLPAFRRLAPVVCTVHDTEAFNGSPTGRLQRIGFTRALAECDRLIVHTRQGRDRLERMGIEARRIALLPHGPLAEPAATAAADPMQGTVTFVLFGKIKPYKGADVLIEAFAALPPALRAQARVRIVGQPYMDMAGIEGRIAALGLSDSVGLEPRFVGDDEVADIFGAGTVAVFPYREIEASGVLSLAVAHGRPIVASRLGSFAETLVDGVHGVLTAPGHAGDVSRALARFIEDRRFAAGAAAAVLQLGRNGPTWSGIAGQTLGVYADAAASRPGLHRRGSEALAKGPVG